MNPLTLRKTVAHALKRHQVSQPAFARRAGVSHSWLNKFLCGHRVNPRFNTMERLQRAVAKLGHDEP